MPLHGAGADEELFADLRVRQAVAGEAGNLLLLWSEMFAASWLRLRTFSPVAISSRRTQTRDEARAYDGCDLQTRPSGFVPVTKEPQMSVTTEKPVGATAFRPFEVKVSEADLDDLRATHCHTGLAITPVRTGPATDGSERHAAAFLAPRP